MEPDREPVPGLPAYILAGGQSSRFAGNELDGQAADKAVIEVAGQVQILRLIRQLEIQGHQVQVVADRADRYQELGIHCLVDAVSHAGPLAGLSTALAHRDSHYGAGWLLLAPVDQLNWQASWASELLSASVLSGRPPAVVFQVEDGVQPLPGLYHTSLREQIDDWLGRGDHRGLRSLAGAVAATPVVPKLDPRQFSFNTQSELVELIERLGLEHA